MVTCRCYEMERRLKTPDLFKFPYFEAICWYVAKNLLEMLKGESWTSTRQLFTFLCRFSWCKRLSTRRFRAARGQLSAADLPRRRRQGANRRAEDLVKKRGERLRQSGTSEFLPRLSAGRPLTFTVALPGERAHQRGTGPHPAQPPHQGADEGDPPPGGKEGVQILKKSKWVWKNQEF